MYLNKNGEVVKNNWLKLSDKYNVVLDQLIVMPNHFHAMLKIDNHVKGQKNPAPTKLGNIIGYFKYLTTKLINEEKRRGGVIPPNVIMKIWQRNYYERIIRKNQIVYPK